MRWSLRNMVLAFSIFSFATLLFYFVLSEMLFRDVGNPETHKLAPRQHVQDELLWLSFRDHFAKSSIVAVRNNSAFTTSLACASELYLTTCGNPGLAALVLMSLDHISLCHEIGGEPTIFWRNCYTVCPANGSVNAWELFFLPVNNNIEDKSKHVICLGTYLGPEASFHSKFKRKNGTKESSSGKSLLSLSFRHRKVAGFDGLITRNVRLWANGLLKKYVKVTPKIQKIVDEFYAKHLAGHNVVAVHVRGTDHRVEREDGELPPLIMWIQNAKYILNSLPLPNKIFIASDNGESIKRFVLEFGNKVIFTSALRAKKYDSVLPVHSSNYHPFKLGSEVLVDVLLMAKCQHFVHAESSVAALVSYFNPDIHTHFLDYQTKTTSKDGARKSSKGDIFNFEETQDGLDSDISDTMEAFECFKENSGFSVCPDMARGQFIDLIN